jgi:hypothetical protein
MLIPPVNLVAEVFLYPKTAGIEHLRNDLVRMPFLPVHSFCEESNTRRGILFQLL